MDFLQQERSNSRLPGITVPSALRGRRVCSLLLSPLEWLVENLAEWTSIVWPCRSASFSLLPWSFCVFGAAALDGAGPRPTTHEFIALVWLKSIVHGRLPTSANFLPEPRRRLGCLESRWAIPLSWKPGLDRPLLDRRHWQGTPDVGVPLKVAQLCWDRYSKYLTTAGLYHLS
jgi:hypothetical protein